MRGTLVVVNAYLSKTGAEDALWGVQHDPPIQAYVVISDKQGLGTEPRLWDMKSNTVGLLLASCVMEPAGRADFPRKCGAGAVVAFMPTVSIGEAFKAMNFRTVGKYDAADAEQFYAGVRAALEAWKTAYPGDRPTARHAGRAVSEIDRSINRLGSRTTEEMSADGAHHDPTAMLLSLVHI